MEALLAGFFAGYAMGVFSLALLATQVHALAGWTAPLQRRFPHGASLPWITTALALAGQALWGLIGLLFGGAYWALSDNASGGLGSPSLGFTVGVLALSAFAFAAAWALRPASWRGATFAALLFAGLFGWFLPHLAEA